MSDSCSAMTLHNCDDTHQLVFLTEKQGKKQFETTRFDRAPRRAKRQSLWPGKIELGLVTLIEGGSGSGKTSVALDLALRTGMGLAWPDGAPNDLPMADILVISQQDELDRIDAHFTTKDSREIYCFSGFMTRDEKDGKGERLRDRPVAFPADLEALDLHLELKSTVGMVLIDNLSDFCTTPRQMSETLLKLNRLAQRHNIAVIVTLLANCRTDAEGRLRVTSRWPTESVRSSWCLLPNPDKPGQKLLVCKRTNFCREPNGLSFRVDESGVAWDAQSAIDPLDPLGRNSAIDGFLEDQLAEGYVQAKSILSEGAALGFNEAQLRSGGRRLGLTSARLGYGPGGSWVWKYAEKPISGKGLDGPAAEANLSEEQPAALDDDRAEFEKGWDPKAQNGIGASENGIARRNPNDKGEQALARPRGGQELVIQKNSYEEIQPILGPGEVLVTREDGELYVSRCVVEEYTPEAAASRAT